MKFKDFGSYLIVPARADQPERYLHEMKRLEWIFIAVRWLWVPMVFVMAWLHHPEQATLMRVLGGVLALCNTAACLFNITVKTPRSQRALGISMLTIDTLLAWGVILLFVRDFYTAAYAGFVYIVLEAAIRFGFVGSLVMIAVFALGLYGAYEYRLAVFGVRFSTSGYAFWTSLMSIVSILVGMIVHEGRKQRWQSEKYLKESTLLSERHRIARELHDTVLKTLQGLSLESRALENRTATTTPSVKETAQYIEEVCSLTSQEIREVIFDLRTEDEGAGIASQISNMLNDWSGATGIIGEFTVQGHDVVLPVEPTRQLRNMVSEALTNVQRHASASRVYIALRISSGELSIEISDDGRGIRRGVDDLHVFVAEGKLGIAGMKERVELLGGSFSLDSDQNGTNLSFKVPISKYLSKLE
jgi:signal transduction histidine kinase